MRNAFFSFLKHLSTNIPTLLIHYIRHDPDNPSAEALQMNCINVHVLDVAPALQGSTIRVSIDLVYDDETTSWTNLGLVYDLFKATYFAPIQDYAVPTAPVQTGKHVYWDKDKVRFSKVTSGNYCHYSCVLTLKYA